jgi:LysM repeat protein
LVVVAPRGKGPGIIAAMTERGLPSADGAPACPFVAFADDRDARSTSPDHRHRCYAETPPAPRAVAHQEAYCLSSAFPVCPTFQEWARREAAQAHRATVAAAASAAAATADGDPEGTAGAADRDSDRGPADDSASRPQPSPNATPADSPPQRNPPRDWAAPPPWATGAAAGSASRSTAPPSPDFLADRDVEGRGLAGSAADLLAGGTPLPTTPAAPAAWSASAAAALSSAPHEDIAELVGGRPPAGAIDDAARTPETSSVAAPPPRSTPQPSTGRRPAASSSRPVKDAVPGPAWERARRYEAYPTIKTRTAMPGLPRVAVLAVALAIGALGVFLLPTLVGIGGGGSPAASPSASGAVATASPSPTTPPAPTAQVYVVKSGDTMSKIAARFGMTPEALCAANKATIKNCDKIKIGDQLTIPAPPPDEFTESAAPS